MYKFAERAFNQFISNRESMWQTGVCKTVSSVAISNQGMDKLPRDFPNTTFQCSTQESKNGEVKGMQMNIVQGVFFTGTPP